MSKEQPPLKDWNAMEPDEQTTLRVEYGHYLDTLPQPARSKARSTASGAGFGK
jgi:hypothetical protein